MIDAATTEPHRDDADRHAAARRARAVASGHSRTVRWLRILLPSAALLIVAGLAGAAFLPSLIGPGIDIGSVGVSTDGIVMANPRLSGREGDRAYDVTAARAVQNLANPKLVELEGIVARITLPGENWIRLEAARGLYDSEAETLKLTEGITVASRDGEDATLASADIDLKTGAATSADPVAIDSPRGSIRAGGAVVGNDGGAIVFNNGVSLTITPGAEKPR
jgi:lipopolysaccharide export system protein LptC